VDMKTNIHLDKSSFESTLSKIPTIQEISTEINQALFYYEQLYQSVSSVPVQIEEIEQVKKKTSKKKIKQECNNNAKRKKESFNKDLINSCVKAGTLQGELNVTVKKVNYTIYYRKWRRLENDLFNNISLTNNADQIILLLCSSMVHETYVKKYYLKKGDKNNSSKLQEISFALVHSFSPVKLDNSHKRSSRQCFVMPSSYKNKLRDLLQFNEVEKGDFDTCLSYLFSKRKEVKSAWIKLCEEYPQFGSNLSFPDPFEVNSLSSYEKVTLQTFADLEKKFVH